MTYEQLLELGDTIGHVSKGLKDKDLKQLYEFTWKETSKESHKECTICYSSFELSDKVKVLQCTHGYHSLCIDKWLRTDKRCPVCNKEVRI